jgi:hypothetical protein
MTHYSQVLDDKQLSRFLEECEEYQVSTGTGSPSDKQIAEEQLATLAADAIPELVQEVRDLRGQLDPNMVLFRGNQRGLKPSWVKRGQNVPDTCKVCGAWREQYEDALVCTTPSCSEQGKPYSSELGPVKQQQAQPAVCTATMIFRRRHDQKIHCRLFKWQGKTPAGALRYLIEQDGMEGNQVRVTIEVVRVAATCKYPTSPDAPAADVYRGSAVLGTITCIQGGTGLLWFGRPASGPATGNGWPSPERALQDVMDWAEGREPQYVKHCQGCQKGGEAK